MNRFCVSNIFHRDREERRSDEATKRRRDGAPAVPFVASSLRRFVAFALTFLVLACAAHGGPITTTAPTTAQVDFGTQSALNPAGIQAQRIYELFKPTLWMLTSVYVIVLLLTFVPVLRNRTRGAEAPEADSPPSTQRRLGIFVSIAMTITIVILFIVLIGDFRTGNAVRQLSLDQDAKVIKITGHQWWWEIQYDDATPSQIVYDSNELHLPLKKTVRLDLESHDVIHSFWAPNIAGKKDLVPGHKVSLWVQASTPGTYWAQCAEFCGYQHAHMRMPVIVQSQHEFDEFLDAARAPAHPPSTPLQQRGQQVFQQYTCSMCHTISGTSAGGRIGPDLTHIGSRATLAAGWMPNSMGHIAGWILDPQQIKPGVLMPQHNIGGDDLQALLEYLESLK